MIFEALVFIIVFAYLPNHQQFRAFFSQLIKGKDIGQKIEDKFITDLVKRKTGLRVKEIFVFNLEKPMGMMPGLPFNPHMILTKGLLKTFSKSELECVVLHEAGHCLLWHVVKAVGVFVILASLGVFILYQLSLNYIYVLLLAMVMGVVFNNVGRLFEYEADYFAVKRMMNPKGMINATEKFKKFYGNKNTILHKLFYVGVPYEDRIKIAEKRLNALKGYN